MTRMVRSLGFVALGLVLAGVVVIIRRLVQDRIGISEDVFPIPERRAEPDPEALKKAAAGPSPGQISLDMDRLKAQTGDYKPLVEYLSYIQVQRGEEKSLIFVRRRDLDTLASLTGLSKDAFVDEFQQMGVLLSMN